MKHIRTVNRPSSPVARKETSDMCLVDYSHCSTSDVCWLFDLDAGCDTRDNCIIDLQ